MDNCQELLGVLLWILPEFGNVELIIFCKEMCTI